MKKPYRYRECGLDNVWLLNGFARRATAYGEALAIEDIEGLYRSIAASLVEKPGSLAGKEVRFLRKQLGLGQRVLGEALGCDEQTVSRWERGETTIPAAADRLLRAYWRERTEGAANLGELFEWLSAPHTAQATRALRLKRARTGERGRETWKRAA